MSKKKKEQQSHETDEMVNGASGQEHSETEAAEQANEEIARLEERIEDLEKELAEKKESVIRYAAEMENLRKRTQKEKLKHFEDTRVQILREFLPINDDLERTLEAVNKTDANKTIMDGVKLVADNFENVLAKFGLEKINETNVPFDVDLHDAMLRQKASDEDTPPNTVLQVIDNGYRIGDRVVKHAKVIVSE